MLEAVTRQVPSGWVPIAAYQSPYHPRDGLVMCQRKRLSDDMEFVVWGVNTIEGGCHNGNYCATPEEAKSAFGHRLERMS